MTPEPILGNGVQTRQRAREQALILFARRSVDAASLKEVAANVGVSEPALYRPFPSGPSWRSGCSWTVTAAWREIDAAQAREALLRASMVRRCATRMGDAKGREIVMKSRLLAVSDSRRRHGVISMVAVPTVPRTPGAGQPQINPQRRAALDTSIVYLPWGRSYSSDKS